MSFAEWYYSVWSYSLLSRIPIPSSRVEAVGLGEERPIGSNETEEGRAKNRRIEVVITLPGG